MAVTTARKVANYLICFARDYGDLLTNLKLQKLVYYAQAWFLALHDEPLFKERLEAWPHGPVEPNLYRDFKQFGWNPITAKVTCPEFDDPRVKPHLDEIMDVYGDLTGHHLERLVHQEDPWKKARKGLPPDSPSKRVVRNEDMRDFYRKMMKNEPN